MPLKVKLGVVLAQKGLRLTDLESRTGISLNNLSILKTGKAKAIRFSTLNEICKALDCQPGDLLEYVSDDADDQKREQV